MKYRTKQNGNNLKYTFFIVCRSIIASMGSSPILVGVSRTLVRYRFARAFPLLRYRQVCHRFGSDVLHTNRERTALATNPLALYPDLRRPATKQNRPHAEFVDDLWVSESQQWLRAHD